MTLVATQVINQAVDHLKERPETTLAMAGDVSIDWRVYNVPDFNLYDQTVTV